MFIVTVVVSFGLF